MNVTFLIARPRSGTTALRECLNHHPKIWALGEVFHNDPKYLADDLYFWNFYLKAVKSDPMLSLPSGAAREKLFVDYLSFISTKKTLVNGTLIVTVNYNSLHCLNYYWQNFFDPPYFFDMVRKRKQWKIIHLVRENILDVLISELRAKESAIWHTKGEDQIPLIHVKPQQIVETLTKRAREKELVAQWLYGNSNCLTLQYEALLEDGGLSTNSITKLSEFLNLSFENVNTVTSLKRTGSDVLEAVVENAHELKSALSNTQFAHLIKVSP